MAAPTFIGVGTTAENTGNISLGIHASTIEDDLLLMIVEHANQPPATRTGWLEVAGSPQGFGTPAAAGGVGLSVWYKFAGASEPAFTWLDTGDHQVGGILTFRGVDLTTPINASVGDADATLENLMVFPDITTTEDECAIVLAMAIDRDINTTNTQFRDTFTLNGAAMTKVLDEGTSANQGGVVGAAVGEAPTAGTYGADGQLGGSNTYGQCRIVIALNPVLSGGGDVEIPVEIAEETDAALTLGIEHGIALATVTDAALALVASLHVPVTVAAETDVALALGIRLSIAPATETDIALTLSGSSALIVEIAEETDAALPLGVSFRIPISVATETDTALPLAASLHLTATFAAETDTGLPLGIAVGIIPASETDEALTLAPGGLVVQRADETDTALTLGMQVGIAPAIETDTGVPLGIALGVAWAEETDEALTLLQALPYEPVLVHPNRFTASVAQDRSSVSEPQVRISYSITQIRATSSVVQDRLTP